MSTVVTEIERISEQLAAAGTTDLERLAHLVARRDAAIAMLEAESCGEADAAALARAVELGDVALHALRIESARMREQLRTLYRESVLTRALSAWVSQEDQDRIECRG